MVIAILGRHIERNYRDNIILLFNEFEKHGAEIMVYAPFHHFLESFIGKKIKTKAIFNKPSEVKGIANLMLSIGGDGTFLESVSFIEDSGIPVAGLNLGRLGFLAHISSDRISEAINQIFAGEYVVEQRSVLRVIMENNPFNEFPFALNEFTLQKKGTSMVTVNAFINGEFLSTYWADGLIVTTPTGSTAYSLSVGGPIISPSSKVFCISPIAPHHLTVRPLIIPDDSELTLVATSRAQKVLLSMDSREESMPAPLTVKICKAPFFVGVININGNTYNKTLRNKLLWGADQRNLQP